MGHKKKPKLARAPKARATRKRPQMRKAYICQCRVCGDGLVRFWVFRDAVVGLCDECELVWNDVVELSKESLTVATGSFPGGGNAEGTEGDWRRANRQDVVRAGLEGAVGGYSG